MTTYPSTSTTPFHLEHALRAAETHREQQLVSLGLPHPGDLVAAAHRASVERILGEVRSALDRIVTGAYGDCTACGTSIPVERLELRPWTTCCVRCAQR